MIIDFINQTKYEQKADIKIDVILKDGTILTSDISHDNDVIDFYGKKEKCNRHCKYFYRLNQNYLHFDWLEKPIKDDNPYAVVDQLVKFGLIVFTNNTVYDNPVAYQAIGKLGNVLLLDHITEEQKQNLDKLIPLFSDFRSFEIRTHNKDNRYGEYHWHKMVGNVCDIIPEYIQELEQQGKTK